MDVCEFSPAYVRAIAPYQPGKPISELAREFGLDEKGIIKLASNENPLGMSPLARDALEKEIAELARYPDGNAFDLKAALARRYAVPPECIVVGNGSNDLLEMVGSAFLAPGRAAVMSQHAFAVYPLATQARGARLVVVPAKNFGHDLEAMAAAVTPEARVIFVANPNNPTGTFAGEAEVARFLSAVSPEVVVVLDEAYNEYLPQDRRYDSVKWLGRYPNLVIVRTFSKIYGLAGLRVGWAYCPAPIADVLNRIRGPFNVSVPAQRAAAAALTDRAHVEAAMAFNEKWRDWLTAEIRKLGFRVDDSVCNFVLIHFSSEKGKSAPDADAFLTSRGLILRGVGNYGLPDCLRLTVGSEAANRAVVAALAEFAGRK